MSHLYPGLLVLQRNWMYLEFIFSSPDIQKQLPRESSLFQKVDAKWKGLGFPSSGPFRKNHCYPLSLSKFIVVFVFWEVRLCCSCFKDMHHVFLWSFVSLYMTHVAHSCSWRRCHAKDQQQSQCIDGLQAAWNVAVFAR